MNPQQKALNVLLNNWKSVNNSSKIGIPPSDNHYVHNYYWDSCFIILVLAFFKKPELACMQIQSLLNGQYKNGFIPNMKFGTGRYFDPERFLFHNYFNSSDYSQPPLLAHALYETYKMLLKKDPKQAKQLLKKTYSHVKKHYQFWIHERKYNKTHLIYCIHPHETGRDSDPLFDRMYEKKKIAFLPLQLAGIINTGIDYLYALKASFQIRFFKPFTHRFCDVMVNCIYAQNLRYLSKLSAYMQNDKDALFFKQESKEVERDIDTYMYDKKDKKYYALKENKRIRFVSIASLFPLLSTHLSEEKIKEICDLIESEKYFNTPFPLASTPINSQYYDPSYYEKRLWRGPVWINMNWYIIEALLSQKKKYQKKNKKLAIRLNTLSLHLAKKTKELIANGCFEFYHPITGRGMRISSFSWSTLGYIIEEKLRCGEFEF
jgi:glycogen debranching enzyme